MLFASLPCRWLLALSLSFNSSVFAQSQPTFATTSGASVAQNSADEAALRTLTETFYKTWAARDIDGHLRLWTAESPELEARRKGVQELFADSEKIELHALTIRAVKVEGSNARVRAETDTRVTEAGTGKEKAGYGKTLRTLECAKEAGHWKVLRETSTYDEIAASLSEAESDERRTAILAEESEFMRPELVRAVINRTARFFDQGDYSRALAINHLALGLAERLGDQAGIARAQNSIGLIHYSQGNYAQSLECLQSGLALDEALEDKQGIAMKLNNIGRIHRVQGNYALALQYYQKSLALSEELKNNYGIALTLLNIGNIYRIQGDYARAMETYQKSLALREAIKDTPGVASTLNNIGRVHYEQGDYAKALDFFQKSLALREAAGNIAGIADALNNLGDAYESQGRHAQALENASRAAELARQIGDVESLWKALLVVGGAYRALKEFPKARQAFEQSIDIIETLRANVAGRGEDRQRFFESKVSPYHALVEMLAREGRSTEALTFAERAKARALLDALQFGRANDDKVLTSQDQEQERKLRAELIMLNTQVTRASQQDKADQGAIGALKSLREKARLNFEAFQTSLYAAHPELRAQRGEAPVIKADEIAALIPDASSALLEYVVTDETTYLFVITQAAGAQVHTLPIKRDELTKQTEIFRRQLATRDLGFRVSVRKLYQLLLKPAEAQLRGSANLIIAPDDKLWDLPFQALLAPDGRYLLERSAVSYVPSLTVLREMKAQRDRRRTDPAGATLLALGNPSLGKRTVERAALALRDEKLTPLPEAEEEVKALGRLYGASRSKVFIGAEAREDRLKIEAGQAGILHFATHGMMNNASPMYSHLVLAQGDTNEDGLLEAWELMQLDLKAELAVLSACETARGRVGAGEGMIGLSWALFVAGVPATVVSQWKVESSATRELMIAFHRQLRAASAPAPKAAALRQAALQLLKSPATRHPFYWAGFVLVGDGG
ncbi:MAG TPA: CHAT domain-containing protein [Blastocatellia bacterium]|nr:CHAT domain-containing protein [Blastocatellia bacterium]